MAEITKQYLDLAGLELYNQKIKAHIASADEANLAAAKAYTDAEVAKVDAAGVNEKITDLENAVNELKGDSTGSVSSQINAAKNELQGNIDKVAEEVAANTEAILAINNEETGILATSKAYTDTQVGEVAADVAENAGDISDLRSDVDTLKGGSDVVGSVDNKIAAAKSALEGSIASVEGSVTSLTDRVAANEEAITKLNGNSSVEGSVDNKVAAAVAGVNSDIKELEGKVTANTNAITTLNSDATVTGSVAHTVAAEIAKVIADAPESYDTLKEIADWIAAHPEEVTALNTAIQNNTNAISALETLIGAVPEGKTVVSHIAESVAAEASRADAAEKAIVARVEVIEGNIGEGKVDDRIATAKSEAISAAATDAQNKVDALSNGQVKTNTDAIAAINNESTGILATAKSYADGKAATAESNATSHADSLNTAMDARVKALENVTIESIPDDQITGLFA